MNATLSVVVTSAATATQIQSKTHRQFSSWGRIIFWSAFHFVIFDYDVPGVACIWGWSGGIFGFILMAGSGRHAANKRNEGTTTSDLKLGFSLYIMTCNNSIVNVLPTKEGPSLNIIFFTLSACRNQSKFQNTKYYILFSYWLHAAFYSKTWKDRKFWQAFVTFQHSYIVHTY